MPLFFSVPLPPPLQAPVPEPAVGPETPWGRYLLQLDDDDGDFEEEEDLNREIDNYAYLYQGERLQDEIKLVYKEHYHAMEEGFYEYMYFNKDEELGE